MNDSDPKSKRHWCQFRMRTLLVVMLLLVVGIGWTGNLGQLREVLEDMPSLRYLTFRYTHVTDAGLVHLQGLEELEGLRLCGDFTDDGLEHLARLPKLERLSLQGRFTCDGLEKGLKKLPKLTTVELPYGKMTDEEIQRLRDALSGVGIFQHP